MYLISKCISLISLNKTILNNKITNKYTNKIPKAWSILEYCNQYFQFIQNNNYKKKDKLIL